MSFDTLGLAEPLVRAVHEAGYTTPTPIQAQAIPIVLSGKDLMGGAQTGTGKTAGFTLPLLHRLMQTRPVESAPPVDARPGFRAPKARQSIRALILTPTRELAAQVEESVRTYGKYSKLSTMVMFGGVGMQPQVDKLRRGVDILVATPGRLLDHHQQGTLDLSKVEIFVLDEADRMLDMGFLPDIRRVLAILPQKKQSLLFSATFSDEIKALADRLLNQPVLIEVARRNQTAELVSQKVHPVGREMKKELLAHLIHDRSWNQVLVFTRMKHGANRLVEFLEKNDITASAIHGNKSQAARTKALADFKNMKLQVLVATDIAARGIDIDQLPHVVNFELPNVPEDYVHRIGRTGRAGTSGEAISLVCVDENGFLRDIERLIKKDIPKEIVPGFEPPTHERPQPIVLGRMVIGEGSNRGGSRRPAPPRNGGGSYGGGGSFGGGGGGASHGGGHARHGDARQGGHGRPQGTSSGGGAAGAAGPGGDRRPRPAGASRGPGSSSGRPATRSFGPKR